MTVRAPGLGVISGILLFLGASSFGDTPDTRDSTAKVADYFTTNRTSGRRWYTIVSVVIAVLLTVSACSFARSGPFSPDVQQQLMLLSLVVWLVLSGQGTRARA